MRSYSHSRTERPPEQHMEKTANWKNLRRLLPYLFEFRVRIAIALGCLIVAKLATVAVPLILKQIVDHLDQADTQSLVLIFPLALLLGYGALRLATALFNELRDILFARARFRAVQNLSIQALKHLHNLSLRFHLERYTGSITRDLERGTQSLSSVGNYLVFIILPTIFEVFLVAAILLASYEVVFVTITMITVVLYTAFTIAVTNWRTHYRLEANRLDSEANSRAVDSLLNYETVKYFNNETYELERYDQTLNDWEQVSVKSTVTMSLLNLGQAVIIALGVTGIMLFAADGVIEGSMTLGDLVLVNALMLQLFAPLNMLGIVYRQLTYALADMQLLSDLLDEEPEIQETKNARPLQLEQGQIEFSQVDFSYQPDREILRNVDLTIPAGKKTAVVGPSGAGKSTLARLIYRFYDPSAGEVLIDGQNIRDCTLDSLRRAIGIVPQDTVLFNDTLYYNIAYGDPQADEAQVYAAARMANLDAFISKLPEGYETRVGERGLKLSGGEKQRVAIARAILKRPQILIFDEATSSLDSRSEQAILQAIKQVTQGVTSLVIAHRLSTIVDADCIYVLNNGAVVEKGKHTELLASEGLYYRLWQLQQSDRETGTSNAQAAIGDGDEVFV